MGSVLLLWSPSTLLLDEPSTQSSCDMLAGGSWVGEKYRTRDLNLNEFLNVHTIPQSLNRFYKYLGVEEYIIGTSNC